MLGNGPRLRKQVIPFSFEHIANTRRARLIIDSEDRNSSGHVSIVERRKILDIVRMLPHFQFAFTSAQSAETVNGTPRIVDGDTVQIGSTKIRFAGIDAPETDQVCLERQRRALGLRRDLSR